MRLISSDGKKSVDIGGSDIWFSIYSTAVASFEHNEKKVSMAIKFMEEGKCSGIDGYEIGRQFNLIRDEFAKIPPEQAVYDINDRKRQPPWKGNISPVITSCANLYTTSDGLDLFSEVVGIMVYAQIRKVDVIAE